MRTPDGPGEPRPAAWYPLLPALSRASVEQVIQVPLVLLSTDQAATAAETNVRESRAGQR